MDEPQRPIYTIGHSTRTVEELIALLRENGVELVVDVRRFPGSRRHPQFGSAALAASLAAAEIGYRHAEALGGRREAAPDPDSPNGAWTHPAFRAYADYMGTPEFQRALRRLITLGGETTTTVMCAEAVPWRCHRRLISDALLARGLQVRDIIAPGGAVPAALSPHARVAPDGTLTYPAPPPPQAELAL